MGFFDRLRKMLAGPPHVQAGDHNDAVALHEEFGTTEEGPVDLRRTEQLGGGAVMPGVAAIEASEAAEAEVEIEEAPPDPDL